MYSLLIVLLICISIDFSESQLHGKIRDFDTHQGFNYGNNDNNKQHYNDNDNYYREYSYKKPNQEYNDHNLSPILDIIKKGRDNEPYYPESYGDYNHKQKEEKSKGSKGYDSAHEAHGVKDYEEGAKKQFGKLDKHSNSGLDKEAYGAKNGYADQQNKNKNDYLNKNFKADSEYSHDRGHGFVKSWSWDRANAKKDLSGDVTKKSNESVNSKKAGHDSVAKHSVHKHDDSGVKAVKGESGYKKANHEEGLKKGYNHEVSDYDQSYPIFG